MHDGEVFLCSLCPQKYYSEGRLAKHVREDHEMKNACVCSSCGKTLKNKWRLKKHVMEVHEGKFKMLKCQHCDFECKQHVTMRRHSEMGKSIFQFKISTLDGN